MTAIRLLEASAVARPGDFVTLRAGGAALLVTRDDQGLHVLHNICPHQGATVCRAASGRAESFECPNHYWVFSPDGTFEGSRLALALGRQAPPDPAKDLRRVPHRLVEGWIEIEDPSGG